MPHRGMRLCDLIEAHCYSTERGIWFVSRPHTSTVQTVLKVFWPQKPLSVTERLVVCIVLQRVTQEWATLVCLCRGKVCMMSFIRSASLDRDDEVTTWGRCDLPQVIKWWRQVAKWCRLSTVGVVVCACVLWRPIAVVKQGCVVQKLSSGHPAIRQDIANLSINTVSVNCRYKLITCHSFVMYHFKKWIPVGLVRVSLFVWKLYSVYWVVAPRSCCEGQLLRASGESLITVWHYTTLLQHGQWSGVWICSEACCK